MVTRAEIVNRALVRIGEAPVAFVDASDEAAHPLIWTYEDTVTAALSAHTWRCTVATRQLMAGAAPGSAPWSRAYPLPPDRLGTPRTIWSDPACEEWQKLKLFEIGQDADGNPAVLTDAAYCVVRYQKPVGPDLWDPPLRQLIMTALMSAYALQVPQDAAKSRALDELAWGTSSLRNGGQFRLAVIANDTGHPTPVLEFEDGPLIGARRGG